MRGQSLLCRQKSQGLEVTLLGGNPLSSCVLGEHAAVLLLGQLGTKGTRCPFESNA